MKVFDLRCSHDHRFEGWFASSEAFDDQLTRGLVACPMCGDTAVGRMPSAPRLNLSAAAKAGKRPSDEAARAEGARSEAGRAETGRAELGRAEAGDAVTHRARETHVPDAEAAAAAAAYAERVQGAWLQKLREVIQNTENVGEAFAEEARRIHYQEAPERAIRGVASREEVAELTDEGIDVFALSIPDAAKGSLQ